MKGHLEVYERRVISVVSPIQILDDDPDPVRGLLGVYFSGSGDARTRASPARLDVNGCRWMMMMMECVRDGGPHNDDDDDDYHDDGLGW